MDFNDYSDLTIDMAAVVAAMDLSAAGEVPDLKPTDFMPVPSSMSRQATLPVQKKDDVPNGFVVFGLERFGGGVSHISESPTPANPLGSSSPSTDLGLISSHIANGADVRPFFAVRESPILWVNANDVEGHLRDGWIKAGPAHLGEARNPTATSFLTQTTPNDVDMPDAPSSGSESKALSHGPVVVLGPRVQHGDTDESAQHSEASGSASPMDITPPAKATPVPKNKSQAKQGKQAPTRRGQRGGKKGKGKATNKPSRAASARKPKAAPAIASKAPKQAPVRVSAAAPRQTKKKVAYEDESYHEGMSASEGHEYDDEDEEEGDDSGDATYTAKDASSLKRTRNNQATTTRSVAQKTAAGALPHADHTHEQTRPGPPIPPADPVLEAWRRDELPLIIAVLRDKAPEYLRKKLITQAQLDELIDFLENRLIATGQLHVGGGRYVCDKPSEREWQGPRPDQVVPGSSAKVVLVNEPSTAGEYSIIQCTDSNCFLGGIEHHAVRCLAILLVSLDLINPEARYIKPYKVGNRNAHRSSLGAGTNPRDVYTDEQLNGMPRYYTAVVRPGGRFARTAASPGAKDKVFGCSSGCFLTWHFGVPKPGTANTKIVDHVRVEHGQVGATEAKARKKAAKAPGRK